MQGRVQFDLFLDDRHHHEDADGDPDLRLHGVPRIAVEALDSQMLLDPFEEQRHLPPVFVKRADYQRSQCELIGQQDQCLACLGLSKTDAPKVGSAAFGALVAIERRGLIAD